MRLRHLVISLPLLLSATQFTKPFSMAEAAGMEATEATRLLAKSQTIDVKCAVLTKDKSQDLKDFVARAEISLAEKASVSVARKTISAGRAEGKAALCDTAATKLVNDVLAAAIAAVAAPVAAAPIGERDEPAVKAVAIVEPPPVIKKTVALVKPTKPKAKLIATKLEKPVKIIKPIKGLGSYAAVAEKYYVANRCGTMSSSGISRLYKTVLASHQQAMANNRPVAVRAMLRTAEARAGSKSCS